MSSVGTLLGISGAFILGNKWTILDPIAAVIVSIFIFKVAYEILKPAVGELMESAIKDEEKDAINKVILSDNRVLTFHKLRTRKIGNKVAIEFHIQVDESNDIRTAHDVASSLETSLGKVFEESIVTIHIEPFEKETAAM